LNIYLGINMPPPVESLLRNKALAEEIDAINAIYDLTTITVTNTTDTNEPPTLDLRNSSVMGHVTTTIILQIPNHPSLSFIIGFDEKYPDTPPVVISTASTNFRGEGKIAVNVLEDIVRRTCQQGQVCLFDVISEAIETFEELNIGGNKENRNKQLPETTAAVNTMASISESLTTLPLRDALGFENPSWILSDVVTEKKSVFIGRATQVSSKEQVDAFLEHLTATDRKAAVATHNISAWRIQEKKGPDADLSTTLIQDCDDDGETAAGGRLLHLMQLMNVQNVLVVVSRWYGGIKLGPDRFRIINNVGRDALIKGGFTKGDTNEKSKRKGRK
jgi:hypothetical protein